MHYALKETYWKVTSSRVSVVLYLNTIPDLSLYHHNVLRIKCKSKAFQSGRESAMGWHGQWNRAADTHVLVRADQEAMMHVSLHQAGLPHALLPQHHHFGIHTHCSHIKLGFQKPSISKQKVGRLFRRQLLGCSVLCDEKTGHKRDEWRWLHHSLHLLRFMTSSLTIRVRVNFLIWLPHMIVSLCLIIAVSITCSVSSQLVNWYNF